MVNKPRHLEGSGNRPSPETNHSSPAPRIVTMPSTAHKEKPAERHGGRGLYREALFRNGTSLHVDHSFPGFFDWPSRIAAKMRERCDDGIIRIEDGLFRDPAALARG